jgi:CubicO group peptidase (beta-lactamase class C family)
VRRRLTVANVLTMTMGLEWNENLPYTSPANSEIAMERAPDRYRFVLERPIREAPGARWGYSGGATALLGRLIARGVGAPLPDYVSPINHSKCPRTRADSPRCCEGRHVHIVQR